MDGPCDLDLESLRGHLGATAQADVLVCVEYGEVATQAWGCGGMSGGGLVEATG